jgi:hypothetical protein
LSFFANFFVEFNFAHLEAKRRVEVLKCDRVGDCDEGNDSSISLVRARDVFAGVGSRRRPVETPVDDVVCTVPVLLLRLTDNGDFCADKNRELTRVEHLNCASTFVVAHSADHWGGLVTECAEDHCTLGGFRAVIAENDDTFSRTDTRSEVSVKSREAVFFFGNINEEVFPKKKEGLLERNTLFLTSIYFDFKNIFASKNQFN